MRTFFLLALTLSSGLGVLAQSKPVAIISMSSGGLIGGVRAAKWETSASVGPTMKRGDKFDWYRLGTATKKGIVLESAATDVPCEEFYSTNFDDVSRDERLFGVAISSDAGWDPAPRVATKMSASVAKRLYSTAVSTLLRGQGLTKPVVGPIHAWKIDLEGDGVDEVILESSTWNRENMSPSAKAGDYSIVAIRQVVAGKPKTTLLRAEVIKKSVEFSAPTRFKLGAILDLNGDGVIELVVDDEYYEGAGAQAWELKSGKMVEVKEVADGCGV